MELATLVTGGLLIAGCVGFLTGVFGVGGGFLITPALVIFLDMPMPLAVGTGLAAMLVTSSFSIWQRRGSKTVDVKLALTIAAGSVIGATVGQKILAALKAMPPLNPNGQEQPAAKYILFWLFLALLIWIAVSLIHDYRRNSRDQASTRRKGWFAKFKYGPQIHFDSLDNRQIALIPLTLLGLGVGILTGLLGLGGGVLLLPALIYLVGQPAGRAAGTSLVLVSITASLAVILKTACGEIRWPLVPVMAVGGILGAYFGTMVGLKLADAKLRLYFAFVVVAAACLIGFRLAAMTFGLGGY